jgi:hypothetical protein
MGGQLMKALALAALLVTAAPVTMRAESAEVIRYNLLVAPPAAWPQACDDALSSYDDLEPVADDFHPVLEFHFHGLDAPDQPTVFIDAEILLPLPPADRAKVSVGTPELFMQQLYFNTFEGTRSDLEALCARAVAALHAQLVASPLCHRDHPDSSGT